jgi:class 3 adenylate cyclase/integral membrane sensor domain MASE1
MAVPISTSFPQRPLGLILLTAVVYFALAWMSLQLAIHTSNATPVWPPSGWALAALLLLGRRVAPGILLGAVAVNATVFLIHGIDVATALATSALIGTGNTGEALAGYFLLTKLLLPGVSTHKYFDRVHQVLRFLLTAVLMSLVSCMIGALAVDAAGLLPPGQFLEVWFTWWSGDATGVLLFTPLLITWADTHRRPRATGKKRLEGILLLTGLILVTGVVFHSWFQPHFLFARSFWVVPFLLWAAVRFDKRFVVSAVMLAALLALFGTLRGTGPFAAAALNDALLATQAFVAVNGVMALLLHAALYERGQIADSLRESHRNLQHLVAERTAALDRQNGEIEQLIRNILPAEVAKELQANGKAVPRSYDRVSVLFTDFKGFSALAAKMTAEEVVEELSTCFRGFDGIIEKHRLEKIKTIGDSYMCAGGVPVADADHPLRIIRAGLEILDFMNNHNGDRATRDLEPMEIRIGVNVGPVVAGVLGTRKYAYDIWGSTVNIASRMESNGTPGVVNISAATYELVKEKYICRYRGKVYAKNVGDVDMYFVEHEITVPPAASPTPKGEPHGSVSDEW